MFGVCFWAICIFKAKNKVSRLSGVQFHSIFIVFYALCSVWILSILFADSILKHQYHFDEKFQDT